MKQFFKRSVKANPADESVILENRTAEQSGKRMKRIVAVLVSLVLLTTVPAAALALNSYINPDKKATLTLSAGGSSVFGCIRKSDTVTLTASVSDLTAEFKKGIYGFTIDIVYDSAVFSYVSGSARLEAGNQNFTVYANPNVSTDGSDVVTVLFFADDAAGELSYINANSGLFSLDFTVTGDKTDTIDFTPFDWKFADKKNDETGFELITLNPTPVAETVNMLKIKPGDINGNDTVDVVDLIVLKKYFAGTRPLAGGDLLAVNASGTPDASDLVWLRRELLGLN